MNVLVLVFFFFFFFFILCYRLTDELVNGRLRCSVHIYATTPRSIPPMDIEINGSAFALQVWDLGFEVKDCDLSKNAWNWFNDLYVAPLLFSKIDCLKANCYQQKNFVWGIHNRQVYFCKPNWIYYVNDITKASLSGNSMKWHKQSRRRSEKYIYIYVLIVCCLYVSI